MKIIIALLIFSAIILFHELGHFLLARRGGITVVEFSLGMGPRILSHVSRRSGTRYSWKLLPFGGSCMMLGEDEDNTAEGAFGNASVWTRMSVVVAGPLFNFLLAFLCSLFIIGSVGYDKPVVLAVSEGLPAAGAGIEAGDIITEIDGKTIHLQREITNYVTFHQKRMSTGKPIEVKYIHDGETKVAQLVPVVSGGRYLFGISGSSNYRTKASAVQVVIYSVWEVKYWIDTTLGSLGLMFQGEVTVEDVSGPVGVVQAIGETYEESREDGAYYVWLNLLNMVILLSANLGVMNLLPFPALDGGRFALLLLEAVRRKRLNQNLEAGINYAGFLLLMVLMVVILISDTGKLLG